MPSLVSSEHPDEAVCITLYIPVKVFEVQKIMENREIIRDLITTISNILEAKVLNHEPEYREGCIAIDIFITADDVWNKVSILQDQIYDPNSEISQTPLEYKPFRAFVSQQRDHYASTQEMRKEGDHFAQAAKAAKKRFFQVTEEEIKTRKVADRAYIVAEKSHTKLQQAFDMYIEVALNVGHPERIKQARNDLEQARRSVDEYISIVRNAAMTASEMSRMTQESRLAAYLCAARAGSRESYLDWCRREVLGDSLVTSTSGLFLGSSAPMPYSTTSSTDPGLLKAQFARERAVIQESMIRSEIMELKQLPQGTMPIIHSPRKSQAPQPGPPQPIHNGPTAPLRSLALSAPHPSTYAVSAPPTGRPPAPASSTPQDDQASSPWYFAPGPSPDATATPSRPSPAAPSPQPQQHQPHPQVDPTSPWYFAPGVLPPQMDAALPISSTTPHTRAGQSAPTRPGASTSSSAQSRTPVPYVGGPPQPTSAAAAAAAAARGREIWT